VRGEIAGRAHRREFTPRLEIKGKRNKVKKKEQFWGKKLTKKEKESRKTAAVPLGGGRSATKKEIRGTMVGRR
jgi:hypothetical protein